MIAERLSISPNRVHYHLARLLEHGLIQEIEGRKQRVTERYYVASARHFVVDPGLGLRDPAMVAALDRSLASLLLEWRRGSVLQIDLARVARRIVQDCARIRQGESVLVMYGRFGIDLGEAVLVEVEAAGARPLVKPWSANWVLRMLDRFSAEELAQRSFLPREIDEALDAVLFISTSVPEGPSPTAEQREKLPGYLEVISRWHREVYRRGLRYAEFGIPFLSEFEHGRSSPEDGATIFWHAVVTDLEELGQQGGRLHERIAAEPEIHLQCARGTDLRCRLDPESLAIHDGVISAADVAARRSFVTLPAGYLSALPVAAEVNGTFVADYTSWGGRHVVRPRVVVKQGRIVEVDAEREEDAIYLRELLAGASGDAEMLGNVSFGLNPAGRGPVGKRTVDQCLEGTVTLHFGNNELSGGDVRSTLSLPFPNASVTVRSARHELVRNGALVWDAGSSVPRRPGYARSGLGASDIERLSRELLAYLETSGCYRDPELRQTGVSSALGVSPGHLSQALRQGLGVAFNDLIGRYRVEEFKRLLAEPASSKLTLLAIGKRAGFASKASFYRVFKRETGLTPAEYQEQLRTS